MAIITAYTDYTSGTDGYPRITIVTPSFNQGSFIEETIVSVIGQNYPNLEYIIIDGGSTDHTVEIIKKYEKHLAYWVSEPDNGQSSAINLGLDHCTGEIFNWLCSDDYLEPGALWKIAEAFKDPRVNVVSGRARLLFPDEPVAYSSTSLFDSLEEMLYRMHICQPSTYFRMNVVKQFGPLNTQLHYMMDAEWWLKYLVIHGKEGICQIDNVLANYRYHDNSKSVKDLEKFFSDRLELHYSIAKLYELPCLVQKSITHKHKSRIHEWVLQTGRKQKINRKQLATWVISDVLTSLKQEIKNKNTLQYNLLYARMTAPGSSWQQLQIVFKRYLLSKMYRYYKANFKRLVRPLS